MKTIISLLVGIFLCIPIVANATELRILSSGDSSKFYPIVAHYEQETGTKIVFDVRNIDEIIFNKENTKNDIIFGEASQLYSAKQAGLLQKLDSNYINSNVNSKYKDPDGYWTGYTFRARAMFYNKKIPQDEIPTFEELSNEKWNKRVCPFNPEFTPNLEFISYMISTYGEKYTKDWLNKVENNFSFPYDKNINIIEAIGKGQCDVSFGINYHYGLMFGTPIGNKYANTVGIYFPEKSITAHLKSVAILKNTKNKEESRKFIEYLNSYLSQTWYSSVTHTYSVRDDVPLSRVMKNNSGNINDIPNVVDLNYFKDIDKARKIIQK